MAYHATSWFWEFTVIDGHQITAEQCNNMTQYVAGENVHKYYIACKHYNKLLKPYSDTQNISLQLPAQT